MTALLVLAGLWLLLGAVWLTAYPLLTGDREGKTSTARLSELEAEKDRLVQELHELELDRATGKLSEEDWRDLDARLKSRAVEAMRELDVRAHDLVSEPETPPG
ncbi:MAG TPA: hypothetical protein VJP59_03350 [Gemmatimonadota bacterium]|nr:hypothetical protein [Gemmatimonadota bacterium]